MTRTIDLRSDTVTRPTPEMRAAMMAAPVGDDVLDDDPTVHRLQDKSARLLGKEAALFMPSGTMSNVVAIKTHTVPGDEVLMDADAHSMLYEVGNPATIAHVLTRQYQSVRGVPSASDILTRLHRETLHSPRTALLVLENSHNRAGGAVIPVETHEALWQVTRTRDVAVHIDGARLFNAAVALNVEAAAIADLSDSITFCLSKGLGCPVGSILCGTAAFTARARRVRKMLGGGLRQAGILAAAGIYALDNHIARLAVDHANANKLARAISGAPGFVLETPEPATNMVYLRTLAPAAIVERMLKEKHDVLVTCMGTHVVRAVTHLDVGAADIEVAARAICEVCAESLSA